MYPEPFLLADIDDEAALAIISGVVFHTILICKGGAKNKTTLFHNQKIPLSGQEFSLELLLPFVYNSR